MNHPSLYEINTRILLTSIGPGSNLSDIPGKYWKDLRDNGIDWIWLMGIWEIREKHLDPHLIPEGMMKDFRALMPDLSDRDISGSPYAIHDYVVDPAIGDASQLQALRKKLNKLGMKLMLDFVPNHFGGHSKWIEAHPEYFIEVNEATFLKDRKTYYRPWPNRNRFFAHGKDPYFDAWQDTVQVNYTNLQTHQWMQKMLLQVAALCDGVRCDMAMLPVHRIFSKTWGHVVNAGSNQEFWPACILAVKREHPDFLLLAECYWDMEAELMKLGFDYCYDKVFYDRLSKTGDQMRMHFHAEHWWLTRTARFLENHDEHRVAAFLNLEKHMASATLVALGPGMRFWHMGQWEGRRKKVPVQISRYPVEPLGLLAEGASQYAFYEKLLSLNQHRLFRQGEWSKVDLTSTSPAVICWLWKHKNASALVIVNFSETEASFALDSHLSALQVQEPVDMFTDKQINAKQVHALAPWAVCVLSVSK